jgi:hypothetical protein
MKSIEFYRDIKIMNTIRELIIQDLIARAAEIATTGSPQDYATDIGATIFRAHPKVDPDDLPCLVVWPQVETAENMPGQSRHRMPVKIEGLAAFASSEPSVISERILGDLIKCFTSPTWDRRRLVTSPASPATYLDPYLESIVYQGGGTDSYPEDGSLTVGASATFLVTYWTTIGDPYSQ